MNQAGQQPKETTFQPIISYNIPFNVLTVFHNIPVNSFLADKYTFIYCMYNCIYIGQLSCDLADSRCWLLRLLSLLALHRAPLHRTLTSSSRSTDDAGSCSVQSSYFQENCGLRESLHPDCRPPVFLYWGNRDCRILFCWSSLLTIMSGLQGSSVSSATWDWSISPSVFLQVRIAR